MVGVDSQCTPVMHPLFICAFIQLARCVGQREVPVFITSLLFGQEWCDLQLHFDYFFFLWMKGDQ